MARVRSGPPSRGNQSASLNSPSRPASTSNRFRAQRSGVGAFASPYWWAIRSTSACCLTCGAGSGGQERWSPKYAMSASCLASDRYRRGAVMSLVTPGPSCFSGPAARMSSRKLSLLPGDGPCGTTGIHTATSWPAMGIDVCGRSGTADRPYCCTRSVFVTPLFWIIQKPLRGSMLTVTGSDDIPSAGGAFRYFLSGVFCPPSTETHRVPPVSIAAIGRAVGGPIR